MNYYTFRHAIQFKDGTSTQRYTSTRTWRTVRGALKAAEEHAKGMDAYYDQTKIAQHAIVVVDQFGSFVTNLAA